MQQQQQHKKKEIGTCVVCSFWFIHLNAHHFIYRLVHCTVMVNVNDIDKSYQGINQKSIDTYWNVDVGFVFSESMFVLNCFSNNNYFELSKKNEKRNINSNNNGNKDKSFTVLDNFIGIHRRIEQTTNVVTSKLKKN